MKYERVTRDQHTTPPSSSERMVLHGTASHGAEQLFEMIDAALWLLTSNATGTAARGGKTIDIILHPAREMPWLRALVSRGKYQFQAIWNWALRNDSASTTQDLSPWGAKRNSLYRRVYVKQDTVTLNTTVGTIHISLRRDPVKLILCSFPNCFLLALNAWKNCHQGGYLAPQRLLKLKHRDVLIGDLIASHAIRRNPDAGGSLRDCPGVFWALLTAIYLCEYAWQQVQINSRPCFVMVPEHTYLHAIYQRVLHLRGSSVIYGYDYKAQFKLIRSHESLVGMGTVSNNKSGPLSAQERLRVETYLNERVSAPDKHLSYMTVGTNRSDKMLRDASGRDVVLQSEKLYVVLFLHSFDDAQYFYGVDGFDDLYSWAVYTIDAVLGNTQVCEVFIKQHPNVNYEAYPGDKIALEKLKQRYERNSKVRWLAADTSPAALAEGRLVVGVTHHGSVAEELLFVRIPVIASIYAPWGSAYAFGQMWSTPTAYGQLLKKLSPANYRRPSDQEVDDLYRFVSEYRLSTPTGVPTTWGKYGEFSSGTYHRDTISIYRKYVKELGDLAAEDAKFAGFVSKLIENWTRASSETMSEPGLIPAEWRQENLA